MSRHPIAQVPRRDVATDNEAADEEAARTDQHVAAGVHSAGASPSHSTEASPLLDECARAAALCAARRERTGFLLMLLSTLGFSGMGLCERVAQARFGVPTSSAILVRGLMHSTLAALALPCLTDVRAQLAVPPRIKLLWCARGAAGATAASFIVAAFRFIPLGDACAIFFTCPVFTQLIAHITLGELVTRVELLAAAMSIAGGFIISLPEDSDPGVYVPPDERLLGSMLALLSSIFTAATVTLIRALGTNLHFMSSVLALGLFQIPIGLALGGIYNPFGSAAPAMEGTLAMILAAFGAFVGQMGVNRGLQLCRAGPGMLLRNIDVPVMYVLGVLVLHEAPSLFHAFGATLIVASAVLIGLQQLS